MQELSGLPFRIHVLPFGNGRLHAFCTCWLKQARSRDSSRSVQPFMCAETISCWSPVLSSSSCCCVSLLNFQCMFDFIFWCCLPFFCSAHAICDCICSSCMLAWLITSQRVAGSSMENHSATATTPFQLEGIHCNIVGFYKHCEVGCALLLLVMITGALASQLLKRLYGWWKMLTCHVQVGAAAPANGGYDASIHCCGCNRP